VKKHADSTAEEEVGKRVHLYVDLLRSSQILGISERTLQDWITSGYFTDRDGLRRYGDLVRVHLPTMYRRLESGELMNGWQKGSH
jgi:hypothetical protein